jgi:hypothetical protein
MIERQLRQEAPTDPISLNGASTGEVAIKGGIVTLQAALFTSTQGLVHFRMANVSSTPGNTLALFKGTGFMDHGGDNSNYPAQLDPAKTYYLQWMLTNAAGTPTAGGADDYLYISVARG